MHIPLFRTASDEKLGRVWERGYMKLAQRKIVDKSVHQLHSALSSHFHIPVSLTNNLLQEYKENSMLSDHNDSHCTGTASDGFQCHCISYHSWVDFST